MERGDPEKILRRVVREEMKRALDEHIGRVPLMSVKDVARTLNVSTRTVERLIAEGRLPPYGWEAPDVFIRMLLTRTSEVA